MHFTSLIVAASALLGSTLASPVANRKPLRQTWHVTNFAASCGYSPAGCPWEFDISASDTKGGIPGFEKTHCKGSTANHFDYVPCSNKYVHARLNQDFNLDIQRIYEVNGGQQYFEGLHKFEDVNDGPEDFNMRAHGTVFKRHGGYGDY